MSGIIRKEDLHDECKEYINNLHSNPNLLINGDFQVWQRGTHFENVAVGKYQADRWQVVSTNGKYLAIVDKVVDGLKITQDTSGGASCVLRYYLEDSDFQRIKGKVCTISKSIDGVITSSRIIPTTNKIEAPAGANVTVNWVKLELGSVATPFIPRPYAEELALCQRYYESFSGLSMRNKNFGSVSQGSVDTGCFIKFAVTKRTKPTVAYSYDITDGGNQSGISTSLLSTYGFSPNVSVPASKFIDVNSYTADAEIY